MDKSPAAFRTISEVAQDLSLPQHVLRFWETRFTQIKPLKRGGGRRYYRPDDIELLRSIRHLLYADGYTIKGVQRLLREHGAKAVAAAAAGGEREPAVSSRAGEGPADRTPKAFAPPLEAGAEVGESEAGLEALFCDPVGSPAPGPSAGRHAAALDRAKLQAVLADLAECERLLAAARTL